MVTPFMYNILLLCSLISFVLLGPLYSLGSIESAPSFPHSTQENEKQKLLPIQQDLKWGYINRGGEVVIKPQFDSAEHFSEGLAFVRYANREKPMKPGDKTPELIIGAGFIDETGKVVLELESPLYLVGGRFKAGLTGFWTWESGKGHLYGYIDKTGKIKIKQQFSIASEFVDGLSAVCIQEKCGFIDNEGRFVIAPSYRVNRSFSEAMAVVGMDHDKIGFINKAGEMVIEPEFGNFVGTIFKEGLAAVAYPHGKFGYIDAQGAVVIPMQFDMAQPFSEGLAAVSVNGKSGYIDKTGKFVIEPQFRGAGPFSEGLAPVNSQTGPAHVVEDEAEAPPTGFIDHKGKMVLPLRFDSAGGFVDGISRIYVDGKFGYVDKTGKYIWAPTR